MTDLVLCYLILTELSPLENSLEIQVLGGYLNTCFQCTPCSRGQWPPQYHETQTYLLSLKMRFKQKNKFLSLYENKCQLLWLFTVLLNHCEFPAVIFFFKQKASSLIKDLKPTFFCNKSCTKLTCCKCSIPYDWFLCLVYTAESPPKHL